MRADQEAVIEQMQRIAALEAEVTRLRAACEQAREALERAIKTATLLHQNSVGCAVNHYGNDFETHGLPGWLADAEADIVSAQAALTALDDVGETP